MTTEQMIAEMQARILKLEKKVYELPPSIYNPFLESMPNPITDLHTHDPNKVAAWKNVPEEMLEDMPDINKVTSDAGLKPLIRDWEVLEFKSIGAWDGEHGKLFTRNDDGLYGDYEFTLDSMLRGAGGSVETGDFIIHSVRRTTDGQVFTVGESAGVYNNRPIRSFGIDGEALTVHFDGQSFCLLASLVKQVTFTTADGVAIFEGDTVYEYSNGVIMKTHFAVGKTYSGPLYSTREAAMKAKPLFTTVDGVDIYSDETLVYCFTSVGSVNEWPYGKTQKDYSRGFFSSRTAAETAYKNWLQSQRVLSLGDVLNKDAGELEELVKSRLV